MRIAVGCDHRGLKLKQSIIKLLAEAGHSYEDFGCHTADSVDYPDIAKEVAEAVAYVLPRVISMSWFSAVTAVLPVS